MYKLLNFSKLHYLTCKMRSIVYLPFNVRFLKWLICKTRQYNTYLDLKLQGEQHWPSKLPTSPQGEETLGQSKYVHHEHTPLTQPMLWEIQTQEFLVQIAASLASKVCKDLFPDLTS